MNIPFTRIRLTESEVSAVVNVLKSGKLVQGEKVRELEKTVAQYCGVKYAIAVNSGTAALHCALLAGNITAGDEVITTPFTFGATANVIKMVNAQPVFADIDPNTFNISASSIKRNITSRTKAILAVNLYGQPADYTEINELAEKHGLIVIEDAAQSIGARYGKKMSGNLGQIGCFSLYATKNIMSGEGGIITTNNQDYYEKMKLLRHHGQSENRRYEYYCVGYNYRMTDIIGALALEQIKRIDFITKKRQEFALLYDWGLKDMKNIVTPTVKSNRTHVYHQYTVRVKKTNKLDRAKLQKYLLERGIETIVYYPKPLYRFGQFKSEQEPELFPNTEEAMNEVLSLPIHTSLTETEIKQVINIIKSAYNEN